MAIEIEGKFYNVAEKFTLYDTIAVYGDLSNLAKQPPGWFANFAAFGAGVNQSFFNVRNRGNTEEAYCNMDARDQLAFAFIVDSIGAAFWTSTYASQYETGGTLRYFLAPPAWQSELPINTSLTLRVQQDDKIKLNGLMASPGYGPTGGGYSAFADGDSSGDSEYPNYMAQTQGVPNRKEGFLFPTEIKIPRRASIAVNMEMTEYVRALLGVLPGPGQVDIASGPAADTRHYMMYGITCTLNGRRLVQQRGELHA